MNKKGFTLVELLSVVAILAILLTIAVPTILQILRNSKEKSFESQTKLVIKELEDNVSIKKIDGTDFLKTGDCENEINSQKINGECSYSVDESGIINISIIGSDKFSGLKIEGTKNELLISDFPSSNLPNNEHIAYLYSTENRSENSTPCEINGNEFTHIKDKRDDKVYNVTLIGNKCLFAENLKYTTSSCLNATWSVNLPRNACREHELSWGTEVLYQWDMAMNGVYTEGSQGLCPNGWHIPSELEFQELEISLGMTVEAASNTGWRPSNQGDMLKSVSPSWCNNSNNCGSYGFNLKPAGFRLSYGPISGENQYAFLWVSTANSSDANRRYIASINSGIYSSLISRASGGSVRCVLD